MDLFDFLAFLGYSALIFWFGYQVGSQDAETKALSQRIERMERASAEVSDQLELRVRQLEDQQGVADQIEEAPSERSGDE